jgi:hypothetical protein
MAIAIGAIQLPTAIPNMPPISPIGNPKKNAFGGMLNLNIYQPPVDFAEAENKPFPTPILHAELKSAGLIPPVTYPKPRRIPHADSMDTGLGMLPFAT